MKAPKIDERNIVYNIQKRWFRGEQQCFVTAEGGYPGSNQFIGRMEDLETLEGMAKEDMLRAIDSFHLWVSDGNDPKKYKEWEKTFYDNHRHINIEQLVKKFGCLTDD